MHTGISMTSDKKNWISHGFIGVNKQGQRSIELGKNSHTPESRLDVA